VGAVSPEELRAAQILTGLTMALFLAVGYVRPIRRHASTARLILLVVYLAACAALLLRAFLR